MSQVLESVRSCADVELLAAAKTGNVDALGQLLGSLRGYLFFIADRYLSPAMKRRVDPDDIVQASFMEAHQAFPAFRGDTIAEFSSWLCQITQRNLSSSVYHHATTAKRSINREASQSNNASMNWLDTIRADGVDPINSMIQTESALNTVQLLSQLPARQSEAIRLRHMNGMSRSDVALRMGESESTVGGLLKRGMATLRKQSAIIA